MRSRHFLLVAGALFGLTVPLVRLLWRAYSSRRVWWSSWLTTEFHREAQVYICLAIVAVAAFAVIGYMIGQQNDHWTEEAENVLHSNFELSHRAATDALTGLFNSRAMGERLEIELENCVRSSLTCLLIDIDHFKRINDQYGHPFGDTVLITLGKVLKKAVRRIDAVGRLGGEEFIVVLPGIGKDRVAALGERVRRAIEQEPFLFEQKRVRVTASIGAAVYPEAGLHGKVDLLKAADDAMYQAKRAGRNRLVIWENPAGDARAA